MAKQNQRPAQGEVMDDEDGREVSDQGMALMALNKSEIDMQITTAKRYPRSIKEFVREATEMVSMTAEVAQECMYSLARGKGEDRKVIEGPSARMAEIVASAWGNCRAGARVIDEDDRFVTAQGAFMDLQRNVAITYEVRRRITDRNGRKFGDDMVGVTANAACSIALRNAVFKGVPKAFWSEIYRAARRTAVGDQQTLSERRRNMLEAFKKMGVDPAKVFEYLGVKGLEDISLEHLGLMIGVFNSIRDGEVSIEDTFDPKPVGAGAAGRAEDLEAKLKKDAEDKAKGEAGGNAEGGNAPASGANNDVQTDGPGLLGDELMKYEADVAESEDEPTLNVISDRITGDKKATNAQREIVRGLIASRRTALKPASKKKAGQQKELGDQ